MHEVTTDILRIEGLRAAHVYVIVSAEGLTLVDTGLAQETDRILNQLKAAGHEPSAVRNIILTHFHDDHAGGAASIAGLTGARVQAHREEVPFIEQTIPSRPRPRLLAIFSRITKRMLPKSAPCRVDVALEDGDAIEGSGGYRAIHTPGHTPGSLCLYHPERRILFCGDALFNRHPVTGRRGLREPIRMFTADPEKARDSIRKLSKLNVEQLFCGHGEPILVDAGRQIEALLRRLPRSSAARE
jgi:glyoxylase-like metal-dependent hydrolase (beta-lactamase superfamily II)